MSKMKDIQSVGRKANRSDWRVPVPRPFALIGIIHKIVKFRSYSVLADVVVDKPRASFSRISGECQQARADAAGPQT
jgi:hypothetical protein